MPDRDDITRFARTLRDTPEADRPDHFASAVIEGGGTYAVPGTAHGFVVVQYQGILTSGRTEAEAISAWIDAAMTETKFDVRHVAYIGRKIKDVIDQWDRDGMPIARKDRFE